MKSPLVFAVVFIAFHVTYGFRVREPARGCSENEPEKHIIGGKDAAEGSAPYQVSLQSLDGSHFCSGAIINNSWILTAAHCLDEDDPTMVRISSGSVDLGGNVSYHFADKFIIHPYYDYITNDVGLVHLKLPLVWNETTSPIKIATEEVLPDSKVWIRGWGVTEGDSSEEQLLKVAEVNYMPYKRCKEFHQIDEGNICTFLTKGVGACFGDSGGPVVSVNDSRIIGIVSWGEPCAKGCPDVHASAMFYHDWVRSTMRGWM